MKTSWTLLQKAVCTLQHFQKQMSKHRKLLILMVIIKTGGHARDRFSLTFLPANAKPVVPVFCQAPHFPETGPKPTGSTFRTGMPSSGQKGPAGGRKKTLRSSIFCDTIVLFPPCSLGLLFSLSLSLPFSSFSVHRKVPHCRRRRWTQVSMTWPFFLEVFHFKPLSPQFSITTEWSQFRQQSETQDGQLTPKPLLANKHLFIYLFSSTILQRQTPERFKRSARSS